MGKARVVVLPALLSSAGCILPVSTGAPLPATTVGKGNVGFALHGESPTVNLVADGSTVEEWHNAAPAATMTATLSYGITDSTDVEVAGEGALFYFLIPIPTGGTIGFRQQFSTDSLDVALAAKVGRVSAGVRDDADDASGEEDEASATFGAAQLVAQLKTGTFRPLAALNIMPLRIRRAPYGEETLKFTGLATSVTLAGLIATRNAQFGPYVTFTHFASERVEGGWFPSFGLMFAFRPAKRTRIDPSPPPPSYYDPTLPVDPAAPPYPPPPAPYPAAPYPAAPYPPPPPPAPAPIPPPETPPL